MHTIFKFMLATAVVYVSLLFGASKVAAQTISSSEASQSGALEEIVVTARRREENLQKSPVAVTALSEQFLQQTGARTFQDFAASVPSLSFVGNNAPENKIVMRGVSTGVVTRDEGSVIGLYIDDVPVGSRRFNPDLRLYDIGRIEVLRGPQGTLFGEGSIGGTLRMVTNKPDLEKFGGELLASVSNTDKGGENYEIAAILNAPVITNTFGFRLVGYQVDDSGFIDNVTLNKKDVNQTRTSGQRLLVTYTPNATLSITGSILHQDTDVPGKAQFDPGLGDLQQARNFDEALSDEFTLANVMFSWDLGGATLESSSAYFDRSVVNLRDISPLLRSPTFLDDLTEFKSLIQEFRLTSNEGLLNNRLDWLVGIYYRDDEEFFRQDAGNEALGGDIFDSDNFLDRQQLAVFGEVDFRVMDRVTLTAGLRWFDIEQKGKNFNAGLLARLPPGVINVTKTDASENGVSPKLGIALDVNDNLLFYGVASRGFREGGPTGEGVPPDPATGRPAPTQYDSDALWNYEFGFKSGLADNRIVLNGAIFYIDWEDLQTTTIRSDGFTFTTNAGSAQSQGLELELRALPTENLEAYATASYVDSTLTEDQLPPGDGKTGDRIPGVPKSTYSLGVNYNKPITEKISGFFSLNYQYVGDSFNGFNTSTGISGSGADKQDAYNISNLRFGLQGRAWTATVFANNIGDERAVLFFNRIIGDIRINTVRPRTVGLEIRYQF